MARPLLTSLALALAAAVVGADALSPPSPSPVAPSRLTARPTSPASAVLRWSAASGNASARFEVYRTFDGPGGNGRWLVLGWTKTLWWESVGMEGGTNYVHRVCVEYSRHCTDNVTTVTPPWPSKPSGAMFALASASYPRIGEATMVRRGGELLCFVSRQSQSQDVGASNVTLKRSSDNGTTWTSMTQIPPSSRAPSRANPGAAVLPSGDIVLTYFVGESHASARRVWRKSSDGGATWTDERNLTDGSYAYMTGAHDRLRLLSTGRLVQPVHFKFPSGKDLGVLVFVSDDDGETWWPRGLVNGSALVVPVSASFLPHSDVRSCNAYGMQEAALAEVSPKSLPGRLLMVARTCTGWLYQSVSDDHGETWSPPLPVGGPERTREGGIRHPMAPPNIARLDFGDGRGDALVLVTEPHFTGDGWSLGERVDLGMQVSLDHGATWSNYSQIEGTGNADEYSYCSVLPDSVTRSLHVTYRSPTPGGPWVSTRYRAIPYDDIVPPAQ